MGTTELIIAVGGAVLGWLGFLEKRLADMNARFRERLDDRDKINMVVQQALKEDIARLESKIDMLIGIQLNESVKHEDRKDG